MFQIQRLSINNMRTRFREPSISKRGNYFGVRITNSEGKRNFIRLGKDMKEARAKFYDCMSQQRSQKSDFQTYRVTIKQGIATYFSYKKKQLGSPNSYIRYEEMITNFQKFLETKYPELVFLDEIKERHISEYRDFRVDIEKIAHKTINCERNTISNMFDFLIDEKNCLVHNPAKKVKNLSEPPLDDFFYSKVQILLILETAKFFSKKICWDVIFLTFFCTGMRRNELRFLTWDDIDFNRQRIYIRPKHIKGDLYFKPKNKEIRDIPIHPELMSALQSVPKISDRWVFVNTVGNYFATDTIRTKFREICKKADVPVKCQHKTRHTWASQSSESEVPQDVIQAIGGWNDPKTMNRYKHLGESHKTKIYLERFTLKEKKEE